MAISIDDFVIRPDTFVSTNGETSALVTYTGIVDFEPSNPINLELTIENAHLVFLIDDNGDQTQRIGWIEDFTGTSANYSKLITIDVSQSQDDFTPFGLTLTATSQMGESSTCDTINFYK